MTPSPQQSTPPVHAARRQAVILAGGLGKRLRERLGDLPKPMIPIGGKPLLEHQVELAHRHDFTDILIFACYRADLIHAHFGDGARWGVRIRTLVEREPLGTAGAVLAGMDRLADDFLVLYGDTMLNVDLERIWNRHHESRADVTLLLHPNDHPLDSDLVETDAAGWITAFHNRPHPADRWFQNLVNAGLYVIRKSSIEPFAGPYRAFAPVQLITPPLQPSSSPAGPGLGTSAATTEGLVTSAATRPPATPMDFGKDLFPELLRRGGRLLAYNSPEFIKDIGTPERYDRISAQYAGGVIARSSLQTPQRAVFLDRDGTLVPDKDCLRRAEDLELLPGTAEALHQLNLAGWRAVLITNQPVIAKGWCTEAELQRIHNKLETLLGREHAFLDRIYFCPHHPDKGFPGERPELKIHCACRKPAPGMILQAARELNLDLRQSWMIGDSTTDLQAAANAGVRSILVRTGCAGQDGKYPAKTDLVFDTLAEAVNFVVQHNQ
jgi:D,D-heptose 1,7-bisphosphate phosphatase